MNSNLLAENDLEKAAGGEILKVTEVTLDKDGNVVSKTTRHGIFYPSLTGEKFTRPAVSLTNKSDATALRIAAKLGCGNIIDEKKVVTKVLEE